MKRAPLLGMVLLILFGTNAFAGYPGHVTKVAGTRVCKPHRPFTYRIPTVQEIRDGIYVRGRGYAGRYPLDYYLEGDQLAIYREYGYTPHRLRVSVAGRHTESWKYYSDGLEFIFDDSSRLIETRHFQPEDNHIE